jgi:hypothetical protein
LTAVDRGSRKLAGIGTGDSDGDAEFREPPGVVSDQAFSVQAVEVAAPEVSVGYAVSDDMPRSDQNGSGPRRQWPSCRPRAGRFGDCTAR